MLHGDPLCTAPWKLSPKSGGSSTGATVWPCLPVNRRLMDSTATASFILQSFLWEGQFCRRIPKTVRSMVLAVQTHFDGRPHKSHGAVLGQKSSWSTSPLDDSPGARVPQETGLELLWVEDQPHAGAVGFWVGGFLCCFIICFLPGKLKTTKTQPGCPVDSARFRFFFGKGSTLKSTSQKKIPLFFIATGHLSPKVELVSRWGWGFFKVGPSL